MKKNIWRLLQIIWLVLAICTIHDTIWALHSNASTCSGMFCESDTDCGAPCSCNSLDSKCYDVG
jgi:hypothetical protein